jgi:hypothetical protein
MVLDSVSLTIGALVSVLSAVSLIGGMVAYYRASVRKEYASERDMNHLKNNQIQLSGNIEQLWRLMDNKFDDLLVEIKLLRSSIEYSERQEHRREE